MRLKQRAGDFRVRELLREGLLGAEGEHRVYRVTKTKLTSLEAAEALATEAGVDPGSVAMAGLKDRQGITVQHMSLHRGREVRLRTGDLRIETIGFAAEELSSEHSRGNAFEITVRALDGAALETLRKNLVVVREHGLVNYFDDQRFGNLRHGQGWIARELMFGRHEAALRDLIAAGSPFDDKKNRAFKGEIQECWGDWTACREVAGRFGRHHSIFEHLQREPEDFAGAFYRVASRLRLIHLYAFQSHLFNRAVAETLRRLVPLESRVVVESAEGPLVCPAGAPPAELGTRATFRLPGPGLEDVRDPEQREALARVLEKEGLAPERFRIEGVPGFQLKGEDRALLLHPQHLRVRPPDDDTLNRGFARVRIRFELPRGAYATLVVKRLFARDLEHAGQRAQADSRPGRHGGRRGSHGGARRGEHRGGGHARSDNRIDNRAERGREGERGGGSRGAGGRGGGRRHGGQGGHGELRPAERREGTRREDG